MMSITNRSRILAMVLAIGMILSLVPVMAAASGNYSVGYANITYPSNSDLLYTISTNYFDANGIKTNGTVGVRISSPDDEVFYYNMFDVKNGKIEFSVKMNPTDVEGKYVVEFESDVMGDRNQAYFYFYNNVQDAINAINADAAASDFDSIAVQQKLATLASQAKVYSKFILNNEYGMTSEYQNRVVELVKEQNVQYTNDADFADAVDEATVLALFNAVKNDGTKSYIDTLIQDADVMDALENSTSEKIGDSINKFNAYSNATKAMVAKYIRDGGYQNFTLSSIVERFMNAVSKADTEDDDSSSSTGGSTGGGNTTTITGGGNTPVIITPVVSVTNVFTDIDTTAYWWLIDPLQALYSAGYINGRTPNTFAPGENITRAEYLKILLLELDLNNAAYTTSFTDVSANDWFYTYVATGSALGIVKGRSDTEFAPNDLITREEICVMTMRAVRAKNITLGITGSGTPFTDQASIADYAIDDVQALKEAGIISGRDTGAFDPKANATRAEAVKILYGVYLKK